MIKEDTPIDSFLAYTIARRSGQTEFEMYCIDRAYRDSLRAMIEDQNYKKQIETKNGNLIVRL